LNLSGGKTAFKVCFQSCNLYRYVKVLCELPKSSLAKIPIPEEVRTVGGGAR
jgi:hypothetical protein